jgi:hypothetical protein
VAGCFGVEEIPKKRLKHLAWNISNRSGDLSYHM